MYESLIEATVLTVLPLPPDELMIPWDAVTLSAIAFVLMVIWGLWKWSAICHFWREFRSQSDESDKLHLLNSFALVALGLILVILFFGVLAAIGKLGASFLSQSEGDDESLRWLGLTFFGLLTALGGILGAPLAIIRINTTERQTRISEDDARIKKREYTTRLLNQATEHLGANLVVGDSDKPNIPLRIGGLLALERIAQDNMEDYHLRIMDMICTYIRANSPYSKGEPALVSLDFPHSPAREDIGVAIDILADRTELQIGWERSQEGFGYQLNLDHTNLSGVNFSRRNRRLNFSNTSFRNCSLVGSYFMMVDLSDADLGCSEFMGADLTEVNLANANLADANLTKANLAWVHLSGAILTGANLAEANIGKANLMGADLAEANMERANLAEADLRGATVRGAKFDNAKMEGIQPEKSVILEYVKKDEPLPSEEDSD